MDKLPLITFYTYRPSIPSLLTVVHEHSGLPSRRAASCILEYFCLLSKIVRNQLNQIEEKEMPPER